MRVVVVEDEIRIREGIEGLLGMLGYDFAGSAENGEDGLALIQREQPDLVITDIRMEGMDGLAMLERMREQGIQAKAIVLSAYSDFGYAQQAIRLGVTEYLLKPVSVDGFSKSMKALAAQVAREKQAQPNTLGSIEQVLSGLFYGQLKLDGEVETYLVHRFGIQPKQELAQLCIYLGDAYQQRLHVWKEWSRFLSMQEGVRCYPIKADYAQSLVILIYWEDRLQDLEQRIQRQILQGGIGNGCQASIGWVEAPGLASIKARFEALYQYMDWGLALGQDVLISYPKILRIQAATCVYPIELEERLKEGLCLGDAVCVQNVLQSFHGYFLGGKPYEPKEIKECYVRFLWAVIHIAGEIDLLDYGQVSQQGLLDRVMGAKLFWELEEAVEGLLEKLKLQKSRGEETSHLTIRRAKSMIHEFYQSGITLEEIALKLHVTPEYLSMQFHKEMGETYSSYLKNYRVAKAKELLLGTQMKQYEIALEVGYADSKYFGKVFRECTGYSPAQYRKLHK